MLKLYRFLKDQKEKPLPPPPGRGDIGLIVVGELEGLPSGGVDRVDLGVLSVSVALIGCLLAVGRVGGSGVP
jgi:hypothetical protein